MDTFLGPYFHFCLELALETWVTSSVGSWPRSVASVQLSGQRTLLQTKSCLKCRKCVCTRWKEHFNTNGPAGIDQGFSTGSCNHHHVLSGRAVHPPTYPCLTLSASTANLSSKWIAPTDNMWPKPDNAKRCHQLLKSHAPPQTKICSTWLQQTVLKGFQSTYTVCTLHTRNQQHLWPASSTPCTAVSWRLVIPRCLLYIIKECIHPLVSNLTVSVRFIDDAKQVPNSISHAC